MLDARTSFTSRASIRAADAKIPNRRSSSAHAQFFELRLERRFLFGIDFWLGLCM
jgi:hypothetical protein